jgi:hypothetical protein
VCKRAGFDLLLLPLLLLLQVCHEFDQGAEVHCHLTQQLMLLQQRLGAAGGHWLAGRRCRQLTRDVAHLHMYNVEKWDLLST